MRVVLTTAAEADLEEIGDWIAKDNPQRALTFVAELRECCLGLGRHPRAYPLVSRYEHHEVRRRVFGNYLVFFRVGDEAVTVLHVLHGARDYEAVLFPEG